MYSSASRRKKAKKQHLQGLIIGLITLLLVIGIAGAYYWTTKDATKLDKITNCPVKGSPQYISVIVDKSDVFNPVQQAYLNKYFNEFKSSIPVGASVSLYIINDKPLENIKADFVICNPGDGSDANEFYQNPSKLRKKWETSFEKPLNDQISAFMQPSEAAQSPIMEMFQIVSLATPGEAKGKPKKLIVISDMLQHTAEWSHYRNQFEFESLKNTPYFNSVRTDLDGAAVEILMVRRDKYEKLQTKRNAYFWFDFLKSINADQSAIKITMIDG